MQVNSIQSKQQTTNNATSFGNLGVADSLVTAFDAISRGGLAASFLTQDVLACGVPRTISSLNRNKEDIGDLNYMAATETGLRETLTGSSMFAIPALVLFVASKIVGPATKVPVCTIRDFSELMSDCVRSGRRCDEVRKDFYTSVFTRLAENGEIEKTSVPTFVDTTLKSEQAKSRGLINNMLNKKGTFTSREEYVNDISTLFTKQKKMLTNDYSAELTNATLTKNAAEYIRDGKKVNSIDIQQLIKSMRFYFDDYAKNGTKTGLEHFKNVRIGTRFVSNIALTLGVGAFLAVLPKIYSICKTNPEAVVNKNAKDTFEKKGVTK